ncbi:MAG: hypothetical protein U1F58_05625 [Burkholderiales bacterium]
MTIAIPRLSRRLAVLSLVPMAALGAEPAPEDCVSGFRQMPGACAIRACTRVVKGGVPLPTTAQVRSATATFNNTGEAPLSVQVTGRVYFQMEAGPFYETGFSCIVEDNMVVGLTMARPSRPAGNDARGPGRAP